jgi:hypothetical protein
LAALEVYTPALLTLNPADFEHGGWWLLFSDVKPAQLRVVG